MECDTGSDKVLDWDVESTVEANSTLISEIVRMIDRFLLGKVSAGEASSWALHKMAEIPASEVPTIRDVLISDGLGALVMLSENEPPEYRTTNEELMATRAYLTGSEPFPRNRLPKSPPNV